MNAPLRILLCLVLLLAASFAPLRAFEKPRVVVLTDIENEPDDAMSLVRFLTYANQFDVEALVATTSIHQKSRVAPQRIRQIVTAYGKVRDNLEANEPGFPTGDWLLGRVTEGLPVYGMQGVGPGKDSPGSERPQRSGASRLGWVGRPVRAPYAPFSKVAGRAGVASDLD